MLQISGIGINAYRYPLELVATRKSGDTAGSQPAYPRLPETPEKGTRAFSVRPRPLPKRRTRGYLFDFDQIADS